MTCRKKGRQKHDCFIDLHKCPKIVQIEGSETTILTGLHGEKMTMVFNTTLPGHSVPLHAHPPEQVGVVYSGKAILRIEDKERLVKKGDVDCIPSNVPHSDTTVGEEPFIMLDIFYPIRKDLAEKVGGLDI